MFNSLNFDWTAAKATRCILLATIAVAAFQTTHSFAMIITPEPGHAQDTFDDALQKRQTQERASAASAITAQQSSSNARQQLLALQNGPRESISTQTSVAEVALEPRHVTAGEYGLLSFVALACIGVFLLVLYSRHVYKNRNIHKPRRS